MFLLAVSVCQASSVTRTFSKTTASPSENINVNLTVSITSGQDTYYAIDESYPSGWTVMGTTGDTNQSGHIKWAVVQAAVSTNQTYVIRAPASPGTYTFSGLYMFNTTYPSELAISGQSQVTVTSSDTTPPNITFYPPTPSNNTVVQTNYIYVNAGVSEDLGTCTLNWYNVSWTNVSMTVDPGLRLCYRNMTGLANGTYRFRVYATDAAGNMNVSAGTLQNTVAYSPPDTTPPSITFVSPTPSNNTNVNRNYIAVNVSLSENPGSCLLNWFNGSWLNYTMAISGLSCSLNMTALVNYTYQFRVYAADLIGNWNVSTGVRQNTIAYSPPDLTNPTIQITSPTSSPTYSISVPTISISGTASDNVAVTQVNWSNNRGGNGIAAGTASWSVTGITLYAGINNITVIARDAAGNIGSDMISVNYTQPCIDLDGDGYGNPASPTCVHPELDCNDSNPNIHPGAAEICNGLDDNCNGLIDENLTGCGTSITVVTHYYDGSTTNFSAINVSNNISGMVLEKLGAGKIFFRENIRFPQSVDIDTQTNVSYNSIYINSSAFPMLNKSATLYIYGLSFVNPILQMDGFACPSSICTFLSYSGGNLTFNVTHFTTYYATEGPYCTDGTCNGGENCTTCPQDCGQCIYCGNGACDGGESCSSCPGDCGQCPAPPSSGGGGGGGGSSACTNGQIRSCSVLHKGKCASGTETCTNGNWAGCPNASQEICNKIDDDCDGSIDNGLVCECFIGETRACGSNIGECREGMRQCAGGNWGECMGDKKPTAEICNGKDDNCNGQIDEECIQNAPACQDGIIPETGCMCGDKLYPPPAGYCFGGVYSETGPGEFPWITVTIFGIMAILILTAAIIYKEFHRKGKSDVTWDDLLKKYKASFY